MRNNIKNRLNQQYNFPFHKSLTNLTMLNIRFSIITIFKHYFSLKCPNVKKLCLSLAFFSFCILKAVRIFQLLICIYSFIEYQNSLSKYISSIIIPWKVQTTKYSFYSFNNRYVQHALRVILLRHFQDILSITKL